MSDATLDWPSWGTLTQRSRLIAEIRRFFEARNVLEVTTPALYGHAPYDPHLSSIAVTTSSGTEYLQTSPEYALKRALAHYGEALFEIDGIRYGTDIDNSLTRFRGDGNGGAGLNDSGWQEASFDLSLIHI